MFGRVLIAVDRSPAAQRAVQIGLEIARQFGSSVWALAVVPVPEFAATRGEVDEARAEGEQVARELLDRVRARGERAGVDVEGVVLSGHPAEVIVSFAQDEGIDLIVMGQKGSSGVKRFLLGGTSDKVSRHAPCSVLLAK